MGWAKYPSRPSVGWAGIIATIWGIPGLLEDTPTWIRWATVNPMLSVFFLGMGVALLSLYIIATTRKAWEIQTQSISQKEIEQLQAEIELLKKKTSQAPAEGVDNVCPRCGKNSFRLLSSGLRTYADVPYLRHDYRCQGCGFRAPKLTRV